MSRFILVVDTKSRDGYVDPYSVVAILPAGEMVCHIILEGGARVDNIRTSALAMSKLLEERVREDMGPSVEKCECSEPPLEPVAEEPEAEEAVVEEEQRDYSPPPSPKVFAPDGDENVRGPIEEAPVDMNETVVQAPDGEDVPDPGMGGITG